MKLSHYNDLILYTKLLLKEEVPYYLSTYPFVHDGKSTHNNTKAQGRPSIPHELAPPFLVHPLHTPARGQAVESGPEALFGGLHGERGQVSRDRLRQTAPTSTRHILAG